MKNILYELYSNGDPMFIQLLLAEIDTAIQKEYPDIKPLMYGKHLYEEAWGSVYELTPRHELQCKVYSNSIEKYNRNPNIIEITLNGSLIFFLKKNSVMSNIVKECIHRKLKIKKRICKN